MRSRALARFGFVAGAALIATIVAAGPAIATDIHVPLNSGQVNKTAAGFDSSCDNVSIGAQQGTDGWVFVLPESGGDTGSNFLSLTLTFKDKNGDPHTVVINSSGATIDASPVSGGILDSPGQATSKAWVEIPLDWTITAGDSIVSSGGHGDFFNVTHVCRGSEGSPSPSPSSSPSPSGSTPPGTTPAGSSSSSGGHLPTTGTSVTGFIIAGVVLLAGGAVLLFLRRRRDVFVSE